MAGNFFTGLNDQLNVNDKQRSQDEQVDILRQRQRMFDVNSAIQNQRADEEMGMKREAAIRVNRAADADFAQKEKDRAEFESHKNDLKNFETAFWGPQPKLVDGKPAMMQDGVTPATYTRDPKNMADRIDFYKGALDIGRRYARTTPEMLKYFEADRAVASSGNDELLKGVYKGDPNSQAAIGKMLGFAGPTTLREGRDQNGLPEFTFVGTDKDGKPKTVDYVQGLFAIGATGPNVQDKKQAIAVAGRKIVNDTTDSQARATSASAAVIRANRPSAGSADSDNDGVSDKAQAKADTALTKRLDAVSKLASKDTDYSDSFMVAGPAGLGKPTDSFRQSKRVALSTDLVEKANGKGLRITDAEADIATKNKFDDVERAALSGRKYVKDGEGYRPAMPAEKGAKDFRMLPLTQWKIQERNRLWNEEFARQKTAHDEAAKKKSQAIPTK
jgi:hypothetical protein